MAVIAIIIEEVLDFIADHILSFDFTVEEDTWDEDIDMETIV